MNPDYNYKNNGYSAAQLQNVKWLKRAAAVVLVFVLIFAATMVYRNLQFHVVNTNPAIDNVAAISPYIAFNFNQTIVASSVSVSSNPDIIQSHAVNQKSLMLNIKTLQVGKQYTITLSVASTKNEHIKHKTFHFTAKDITYQNLSRAQQQAIMQEQTKRPPSRNDYAYVNNDTMTNEGGLTQEQLADLEQGLFQYFQAQKIKVSTVTFSNIMSPAPHPDQPLAPNVTTFDLSFAGKNYSAKLATPDLSTARLYLYSQGSSKLLDDSKNINTGTSNS